MSFLIKDILKKKDESCSPKEVIANLEKRYVKQDSYESTNSDSSYSILQQTLLNKVNPYYSQNSGECFASDGFYSFLYNNNNNNNSEMYKFSTGCTDFNIQNGNPYISLYPSTAVYSPYEALPFLFRMSSKRKGGQVRFTALQTDALEKKFNLHKYLSPEDRKILADSLKLSDKQVKTWFQNRRAKWRRYHSTSSSSNPDSDCEKAPSERDFRSAKNGNFPLCLSE